MIAPRPNVMIGSTGTPRTLGSPCHTARGRVRCAVVAEYVLLIRHGETDWSAERRHTGRTDLPLNGEGERRARQLAPFLASFTEVATATVFTSPLLRARQTCALAGMGERATVDDDLVEWDYGEYEGTRTADLRASDPDGRSGGRRSGPASRSTTSPGAPIACSGGSRPSTARWCCSPTPTSCASSRRGGAASRPRWKPPDAASRQCQRARFRTRGGGDRPVEPQHRFTTWGGRSRLRWHGQ